jgi:hypothetical protein
MRVIWEEFSSVNACMSAPLKHAIGRQLPYGALFRAMTVLKFAARQDNFSNRVSSHSIHSMRARALWDKAFANLFPRARPAHMMPCLTFDMGLVKSCFYYVLQHVTWADRALA